MSDTSLQIIALDAANMLHLESCQGDMEANEPTQIPKERVALLDFETCCRIPMVPSSDVHTATPTNRDTVTNITALEPMLLRNQAIGKEFYTPIETRGKLHEPIDGYACDMWALGIILLIMLTSRYPFLPRNEESAFAFYKHLRYHDVGDLLAPPVGRHSFSTIHDKRPLKSMFPNDAIEVMRLLLHPDRRKRMTAAQLLRHPWVALAGS